MYTLTIILNKGKYFVKLNIEYFFLNFSAKGQYVLNRLLLLKITGFEALDFQLTKKNI